MSHHKYLRYFYISLLLVFISFANNSALANQDGQKSADLIAQSSARAVFNLNTDQLIDVLGNILNDDKNIKGLVITESIDNERLLSYYLDETEGNIYNVDLPKDVLNLASFTSDIIFENEQIGTVTVYYSAENDLNFTVEELDFIQKYTIKVGIENWPPVVFEDDAGNPQGITTDYLKLISERTGLTFRYVFDEWTPLLNGLRNKTIDLLPATYFTEERAEYGLYSQPYFTMREFIFVKSENDTIRNMDDLANGRIAIVQNFGTIPKIKEAYPNVEIIETPNLLASINAVLNGEVDATFEVQSTMELELRKNGIRGLKAISQDKFPVSPIHFFSVIDKPLLQSILEKGMDSITEEDRIRIWNKWVGNSAPQTSSQSVQEQQSDDQFIIFGALLIAALSLVLIVFWLAKSQSKPFLKSLRGKSTVFILCIFGIITASTWWMLNYVGKEISIRVGKDISERHVLWHKERVLGAIQRDLALSEQMAESEILVEWANDVNNFELKLRARNELQRFRDNFSGETFFLGLKNSGDFYYNDKSVARVELKPIETLSETDEDDGWFFATMNSPEPYNLNVDNNKELGLTNLWVNYAMRSGGETLGVVGTGIPLSEFIDDFISSNDTGVTAIMIDSLGAIQAHPEPDKIDLDVVGNLHGKAEGIWKYIPSEEDRDILKERMKQLKEGQAESYSILMEVDGIDGLLALSYLDELDWYSLAIYEPSALLGDTEFGTLSVVILFTFIVALIFLLTGLNILVIKPLKELGLGTQQLASGSYDVFINIKQKDEFGDLADSFNIMAATIHDYTQNLKSKVEQRTQELQEKETMLRMATDNMPGAMSLVDKDLKVLMISKGYKDFYGEYDVPLKPGSNMKDICRVEIEEGLASGEGTTDEILQERINSYLTPGTKTFEDTSVDGRTIQISRVKAEEDKVVSIYVDVSERKRAEKQLKDAFDVISSSINYASHIQKSVLPDKNLIKEFTEDSFIWWEPRDVVGGDFYWAGSWGEGNIILLGDCTGHGVPGAFMTLISIAAIERAVSEIPTGNLGKLISTAHQYIQIMLDQHYEGGQSDDGLELGACYFVPEQEQMKFVGTRFNLIVLDDEEINTVKGTKAGMAYRNVSFNQVYQEEVVQLKQGQQFYLASDGIIDQVGGERKRSFGRKRLMTALEKIKNLPMSDQKAQLQKEFSDYQGNELRRDDVSVIGFKLRPADSNKNFGLDI